MKNLKRVSKLMEKVYEYGKGLVIIKLSNQEFFNTYKNLSDEQRHKVKIAFIKALYNLTKNEYVKLYLKEEMKKNRNEDDRDNLDSTYSNYIMYEVPFTVSVIYKHLQRDAMKKITEEVKKAIEKQRFSIKPI